MRISSISLAIIVILSTLLGSALHTAHAFPRTTGAAATTAAVCPYRQLFSLITRKMVSLPGFLSEIKNHPTDHIVIGNEAGDADSMISAISLAYVESVVGTSFTKPHPKHWKTPIVSIPHHDLESQRPETMLLLQLAGIDKPADKLIFVDDMDAKIPEKCQVTLVDHNRFADRFQKNGWTVVEIADHHKDLGFYTDTCSGNARTIAFEGQAALVASTCTLVVERLVQTLKPPYPTPLSTLLLGTILLDSVNMNPAAGKGTKRDATAIQQLLDNTDWSLLSDHAQETLQVNVDNGNNNEKAPNTTAFFDALQNAKFDLAFWKSLSVRDALRLDYKEFTPNGTTIDFGMSTVLMSLRDFDRKGVQDDILSYMKETDVPFLGIMFAYQNDDGMLRQLTLCGVESFPLDGMVSFLLKNNSLGLVELQGIPLDGQVLKMQSFQQTNVQASRKQVAPLLMEFFEQSGSNES